MKDKLVRTFFSIPVPERVRSVKNLFYRSMKDSHGEIRWVRDYQLHITLSFLGHTPSDAIDPIIKATKEIFSKYKPLELTIEKTGCFPVSTRPRVLWLGVSGDREKLDLMVKEINGLLTPMGYFFGDSSFIPHITIARIRYPQKHTPDINEFLKSSYDGIVFHADRVQFVCSELLPDGAVYTILKSFPLGENI